MKLVEIVDELKPAPEDRVIWKPRSNSFYSSTLELMLRSRGVDTVILTGAVVDSCIQNTARGARERDSHFIVLSDCCAASSPEFDDFYLVKIFPKEGRVRTSDEMIATIAEAAA